MLKRLTLVLLLAFVSGTQAQDAAVDAGEEIEVCEECPLSDEEWTPLAKTLLARMLVGESGWLPEYRKKKKGRGRRIASCVPGEECFPNRDWKLQPWVIWYRWQDMKKGWNGLTYAGTIQLYSAAMKPGLASVKRMRFARVHGMQKEMQQIPRRRFLQSIEWDGSNLLPLVAHYRRKGEDRHFVDGWRAATRIVESWGAGDVAFECEEARHWDGPGMSLPRDLIKIDCGETLNDYFTTEHARRKLRRQRRLAQAAGLSV